MKICLATGYLEALYDVQYGINLFSNSSYIEIIKDLEFYKNEYYDAVINLYEELDIVLRNKISYNKLCELSAEEFIIQTPLYLTLKKLM